MLVVIIVRLPNIIYVANNLQFAACLGVRPAAKDFHSAAATSLLWHCCQSIIERQNTTEWAMTIVISSSNQTTPILTCIGHLYYERCFDNVHIVSIWHHSTSDAIICQVLRGRELWRSLCNARKIFLGGHPAMFQSPTIVCAMCVLWCICTASVRDLHGGPSW